MQKLKKKQHLKDIKQINFKKATSPKEKRAKITNRQQTQETRVIYKYMKRCSTSLVFMEIKKKET